MKANELKIGNWINFIPDKGNFIISDIKTFNENTINGLELEDCQPIPLTEEWLLKFGFVKVKDDIFRLLEDDIIICTVSKIGSDEFEYEQLKVRGIYVQFVHQLQNLYFALTGEELTYGGNK